MVHDHPERGTPLRYTVTRADGSLCIDGELGASANPHDWVPLCSANFASEWHTAAFSLPDGSLLCLRLQP
jgi:hypothetical protein